MLYLGTDHGGFKLKERLKVRLNKSKIAFHDIGAHRFNPRDDYPDFATRVSRLVANSPANRGLLLCRNGVGVCIVANKTPRIRAVIVSESWTAKHSRRDDDANVLCLGADRLSEAEAWRILKVWLETPFRNTARDRRRIQKIHRLEYARR